MQFVAQSDDDVNDVTLMFQLFEAIGASTDEVFSESRMLENLRSKVEEFKDKVSWLDFDDYLEQVISLTTDNIEEIRKEGHSIALAKDEGVEKVKSLKKELRYCKCTSGIAH
jgi:hypothetical protein